MKRKSVLPVAVDLPVSKHIKLTMDPADIAARALANMDESLYGIDEEISATYNTDDNSAKRMKRDSLPKVPKPKPIQPPPSSLIVSFKNQEGRYMQLPLTR